uniref:AlNc14C242G9490 protein n=1 Tax=Albugo laibachii Nc14 TaxID=890382 RepID=F0WT00_9STRA|nr:AlNc14C242G9490 [Albugo laibachii Nc14]|eukprot:CCA24485.1 AlNc14C242G9490 [Albugo laibachii Nc14]
MSRFYYRLISKLYRRNVLISDMVAFAGAKSKALNDDNGDASSGIDSVEHSDSNPSCCDEIDKFSIDRGGYATLLQGSDLEEFSMGKYPTRCPKMSRLLGSERYLLASLTQFTQQKIRTRPRRANRNFAYSIEHSTASNKFDTVEVAFHKDSLDTLKLVL